MTVTTCRLTIGDPPEGWRDSAPWEGMVYALREKRDGETWVAPLGSGDDLDGWLRLPPGWTVLPDE